MAWFLIKGIERNYSSIAPPTNYARVLAPPTSPPTNYDRALAPPTNGRRAERGRHGEEMGNRLTVDRFREAVLQGDHRKAEELFYNKKQLRDHVDPRDPCFKGGSSILHYTARHAMMPLYLHFIENEGTDPLVEDDKGQNCLHLICCSDIDPDLRFDMLSSTLKNDFVSRDTSRSISTADHVSSQMKRLPVAW